MNMSQAQPFRLI